MAMRTAIASRFEQDRMRQKIILHILGDKGGVGKSIVARAAAAWLRKFGYLVHGCDGDHRNAHLQRFYARTMEVTRHSLRSADGWGEMYNDWEAADGADVILLDTPAGVGDALERETSRILAAAAALSRRIINVWVADEGEDSVALLPFCYPLAAPSQTLFIMNGRFGESQSAFKIWNESKTRAGFLALGGHESYLPRLPVTAVVKIATARSPFDDLSSAGLSLTDRIDFDIWWAGVETALSPLKTIWES